MINLDDFENKLKSPARAIQAKAPESTHPRVTYDGAVPDAEIAVRCLDYLAGRRADDYQDGAWVEVGMALHHAGATVGDWDRWSQQSEKYKEGECERKWKSFGKRNGQSVTVASLIQWAADDSDLGKAGLLQRINPTNNRDTHPPLPEQGVSRIADTNSRHPAKDDGDSKILPVYVCMKDVEAEATDWLWTNRFPRGMLSLLIGLEGCGKTFVSLDMAARISTGRPWPDSEGPYDAPAIGNVIFLTSEDHLRQTVRPRLDSMGADPSRVFVLEGVKGPKGDDFFNIMDHMPALESMIESVGEVQLVIVDPLTAFLGSVDQHRNGEVRSALARFSAIAEKYGCTVLGISHLSKDTSRVAVHRTLGSVAFTASARAVWLNATDKDDSDRRLLVPVKMNLSRFAKCLAYTIDDGGVQWEEGQFEYSADEVLGKNLDEGSSLKEARQWLESILAGGKARSDEIVEMAKDEGIHIKTLRRAKNALKIKAERVGFGTGGIWYWELPTH